MSFATTIRYGAVPAALAALLPLAASPSRFDLWVMQRLAQDLGKHPGFDQLVVLSINTGVLGGVWFAAALFVLWMRAQTASDAYRRRVITILLGSLLAILSTLVAQSVVHWPPPANLRQLSTLYPDYIRNPNVNSFPSQSTALYAEVAMGASSISPLAGGLLWLAVAAFVALPRMYVGGHYPSDIAAGLACAAAGYWLARALEPRAARWLERLPRRATLVALLNLILFVWIWQVAMEFSGVNWARRTFSWRSAHGNLYLGGDPVFGQYFQGRIDEVRIYNRCLSHVEVQQDMQTRVTARLAPGLVAAYAFDGGSADAVADLSGNGNDGAIRDGTWTPDGRFGGALRFDGVSSRVEIKDSPTLRLNSAMTLEAWVYPTRSAYGWADIVYRATDLYALEASSMHGPPAALATLQSGLHTAHAQATLPQYRWSHLAATYDGSTLLLYVNGELAGDVAAPSSIRTK